MSNLNSYEESMEDRKIGLMCGLAYGDRNGGPIRMATRIVESLIEKSSFDLEDIIKRFKNWYIGPPNDEEKAFDSGNVFNSVFFLNVRKGICLEEAVKTVSSSAGVNPAHRSTPMALATSILETEASLLDAVKTQSSITHINPLSQEVACLSVLLCRKLIEGDDWSIAFQDIKKRTLSSRHFEVQTIFSGLEEGGDPFSLRLDKEGFSPQVFRAALFFVNEGIKKGRDLISIIEKSIEFAGGANYCPVLVGAFAGAALGKSHIPLDAVRKIHGDKFTQRVFESASTLASLK